MVFFISLITFCFFSPLQDSCLSQGLYGFGINGDYPIMLSYKRLVGDLNSEISPWSGYLMHCKEHSLSYCIIHSWKKTRWIHAFHKDISSKWDTNNFWNWKSTHLVYFFTSNHQYFLFIYKGYVWTTLLDALNHRLFQS